MDLQERVPGARDRGHADQQEVLRVAEVVVDLSVRDNVQIDSTVGRARAGTVIARRSAVSTHVHLLRTTPTTWPVAL